MKIRIQKETLRGEIRPTYFVDYEYEDGWKNHSSHRSYDDALASKTALRKRYPNHKTNKDCWCEPEHLGNGVYLHRDLH